MTLKELERAKEIEYEIQVVSEILYKIDDFEIFGYLGMSSDARNYFIPGLPAIQEEMRANIRMDYETKLKDLKKEFKKL